ncbi:A disintegrin and metalloproteinase with thrombospondin motifs 7-like [Bacillus rossius redtenbacheri]|uniref:A disintegrin and metalloproteinase with thrombospondin motifs 7-like n=1 Tax=Bacillus rossius redtenbacheri TaxID=93214 RepID=UPI002FDE589E
MDAARLLLATWSLLAAARAHSGLYSGKVTQYEVVVPKKVTPDGEFLSYNLVHHHRHSHRSKRSLDDNSPAEVHYQLPVAGQTYHLELRPSRRFLSPSLVVEQRASGRRDYLEVTNTTCHYHGAIRGQPGSMVAISTCHGLAGMLKGSRGLFWLEPAVDVVGGASAGQAHLVFRRAAPAAPAGPRKRRRRKRRRHEKNCGTREPRRLTEARLEWKARAGRVKVQGRGKARRGRARRSASLRRHVEALLVADASMMAFHRDRDVQTYFLTIMNMVSLLYADPSIGNYVSVVVVRIVLLLDDEDSGQRKLEVTVNADQTLENFCAWQLEENFPDDGHPQHHDVAILVTREDICARQNAPCSTLGVAHVAGMCNPLKSCNVNEDNGISLAHTITHEMGHNFGMYHDTEKIGCSRRSGRVLHVMTPSFEADTVGVAWSRCSRRDITNFLDQGYGDCLQDEPASDLSYPDLPPGAMYDADHQCRLQFGERDASVCSPQEEICSRLWCSVDGMCATMLRPAAAGTSCGKHMWCLEQKCEVIGDRPAPIHGGWGDWGPWSWCSRSCGAGVSVSERHCDHPVPAFGGRFCVGQRRRYKTCNTQKCPEGSPSFRSVQCSAHDNHEYRGRKYKWLPYFDKAEPCELYCTDSDDSMIVPFGDSVEDGTPCNVGHNDMCIRGVCKRVGCDWVVDSNATEDRCGICRGDGSQCKTLTGEYNHKQGTGYEKVVQIPAGSRNIVVKELGNSRNFIGVGDGLGKFFLNGKRQITLADEYEIAGTPALYEREKDLETVHIPGPIKEDIMIYLIHRGKYRNFGLRYEYTAPEREPAARPEYRWTFSDWSPCSATCGGGAQTSQPACREKGARLVDPGLCPRRGRPAVLARSCNDHPCPPRLWTGLRRGVFSGGQVVYGAEEGLWTGLRRSVFSGGQVVDEAEKGWWTGLRRGVFSEGQAVDGAEKGWWTGLRRAVFSGGPAVDGAEEGWWTGLRRSVFFGGQVVDGAEEGGVLGGQVVDGAEKGWWTGLRRGVFTGGQAVDGAEEGLWTELRRVVFSGGQVVDVAEVGGVLGGQVVDGAEEGGVLGGQMVDGAEEGWWTRLRRGEFSEGQAVDGAEKG